MRKVFIALFSLAFALPAAADDRHSHGDRRAAPVPDAYPVPADLRWEDLSQRVEALAESNPAAAEGIRSFLESIDFEQRPRALYLSLQMLETTDQIRALQERRATMSREQFERSVRPLFKRLDDGMVHQLGRGIHPQFMSSMGRLFTGLDRSLLRQHAEHWVEADRSAAAYQFAASQRMSDGRHKEAAEAASQASRLDPQNPRPLEVLVDSNYKMGNYRESYEAAKRLEAVDPGNALAQAHLKLPGREPGAGPDMASPSIDAPLSPPTAGAPSYAGAPSFSSGETAAPLTDPDLRRSAGFAQAAKEMLKNRQLDQAVALSDAALKANPQNVEAMYYKALAYGRSDRFQEAFDLTKKGLELAPNNSPLLAGRALIYNLQGRYDKALAESDLALEANASNYHALFTKAWALAGLGRRQDALAMLKRATRIREYHDLYQKVLQLPPDTDLLPYFRGEGSPGAPPPPTSRGDARRYMIYGLLILVSGFMIALGILHHLYGGPAPAYEEAPGAPAAGPAGGAPFGTQAPSLIAGMYRVLRKLGIGGMGVVYEAVDQTLERKVAIKKMREEIRADPRERERFLREARTVAGLRHPNIVEIYSIVEEGEDAYLVFEHVDGRTVHDIIQASQKLEFRKALDILSGVAAALDYAHGRGVIHRDLKPSNIMVDREGRVKVMDFGVARQAKDSLSRLSMTNTVVGTPPYMAPEQEQGVVRKESDVYALAVCFYEMLTGVLPFSGVGAGMLMSKLNKNFVPPASMIPGLPGGIDQALAKALDPDPDLRFKSAGEFLAGLASLPAAR